MTDRDCERLRAVAEELTLGALAGQERAEAVAHLGPLPRLPGAVERLTLVGDGLLALLPGSEPPAGFETRVTDVLGLNRSARRWQPRAVVSVTAAAVIALGSGFGGWAMRTAVEGPAAPPSRSAGATGSEHGLLEAPLLAPDHPVGRIFACPGSPGWAYMSVDLGQEAPGYGSRGGDGYPEAGKVSCRLERTDGTSVPVGTFSLDDGGRGHWGAPRAWPRTRCPGPGCSPRTAPSWPRPTSVADASPGPQPPSVRTGSPRASPSGSPMTAVNASVRTARPSGTCSKTGAKLSPGP